MRSVGAGAAARTAVSFADPREPGARYWVDFRSQADGHKYAHLGNWYWAFHPQRGGLQIQRTDPQVAWATTVLERPGDGNDHRQLSDVGERVKLGGGAWVQLDSISSDGRSGTLSINAPCAGAGPEPEPAALFPSDWVTSPGTKSGTPHVGTTVGVSTPTLSSAGTAGKVTARYQWLLDSQPVPGATRRTWVPPVQALGRQLTLSLELSAPGYLTRSGSFHFGRVTQRAVPAEWVAAPALITGTPRVGRTLSVSGPRLSATAVAAGATVHYQWFLDGAKVPGATSRSFPIPTAARGKSMTLGIAVAKTNWNPLHRIVAVGRVR